MANGFFIPQLPCIVGCLKRFFFKKSTSSPKTCERLTPPAPGGMLSPEFMTMADQQAQPNLLKPLLLCTGAEDGALPALERLFATPGLDGWEIAVSHSSRERGRLPLLARRAPVFLESEADRLIARLGLFHLLVVSPLSLNTLAKFALGIRDSFPSRLLWAAAEAGMPVLLDETSIRQGLDLANPHLAKVYRRHWEHVCGGTTAAFRPDSFAESVAGLIRRRRAIEQKAPLEGRGVVTRDDVVAAHRAMTSLRIQRGTLVTDLARDEAAALGVTIEFSL